MVCAGRHLTIGAVLLLGWAVSGCVSLEEYRRVQFENDRLTEYNNQVQADLERERAKAKQCSAELQRQDATLKQQQNMIELLENDKTTQAKRIEELMAKYTELANRPVAEPVVLQSPALPPEVDKALKEFARKYPDRVTYDPLRGMVKFGSDLLFDLGDDTVRPDARDALAAFAEIMDSPAAAGFDVIVVGHTDNVPIRKPATKQKHPTNWHLSVHRAISVMNALKAAGVQEDRMGVLGYGEFRPIAPNTKKGNPANRRVELYIVAKNSVCVSNVKPAPGR